MLYWGQLLLQPSQDVISTNSKQKSNQHNNKKLGYISKKQPFLFINYQQNQRNHHVCISSERLADRFFIFISDLLTVVGVPAIDPVLKRAQFNQKINSLTQVLATINNPHLGPHHGDHVQDDSKKYKRNVSSETRRYAAIRLAASTSSLSQVGFVRLPLLAQQDSSELDLNHHDWYLSNADSIFITSSFPPSSLWSQGWARSCGLSKSLSSHHTHDYGYNHHITSSSISCSQSQSNVRS